MRTEIENQDHSTHTSEKNNLEAEIQACPTLAALASYFQKWATQDKTLRFNSAAGLRRDVTV